MTIKNNGGETTFRDGAILHLKKSVWGDKTYFEIYLTGLTLECTKEEFNEALSIFKPDIELENGLFLKSDSVVAVISAEHNPQIVLLGCGHSYISQNDYNRIKKLIEQKNV